MKAMAKDVLKNNKTFSIEDYKNLNKNQILILKKYAKMSGIKREYKFLNFTYKQLKKALKCEFPQGCTLVSVGRSPARYVRMFELDGNDVKYCPSVSLKPGYSWIQKNKEYMRSYFDYLDKAGINKHTVKSAGKPFVFVDYTQTGGSLETFRKMLHSNGIKGENALFRSVNDDLWGFGKESKSMFERLKKYFMSEVCDGEYFTIIKEYSPIPHLSQKKSWRHDEVASVISSFREPFESKLMSFVMLDKKFGEVFLRKIFRRG